VAHTQQQHAGEPLTVGILWLNKPSLTEFAGPLDVYHHVPAEKLDVLVVPSGAGSLETDLKNVRVITWLQKAAREAEFITSHCEGAFLLGQAGLLDNKNATTFPVDTETLQKQYPTCRVQTGQRLVVDGNVITSPGGLASYEASLYVVEQLCGKEQALSIAAALVFGPSHIAAALPTK
jgi:transcriptional regulator GlxA family with amidase domain